MMPWLHKYIVWQYGFILFEMNLLSYMKFFTWDALNGIWFDKCYEECQVLYFYGISGRRTFLQLVQVSTPKIYTNNIVFIIVFNYCFFFYNLTIQRSNAHLLFIQKLIFVVRKFVMNFSALSGGRCTRCYWLVDYLAHNLHPV